MNTRFLWFIGLFLFTVGQLSAKAIQFTDEMSDDVEVQQSTMTVSVSTQSTKSPMRLPELKITSEESTLSAPKYQQIEEPYGEWHQLYGKVEVMREEQTFRIRTPKGEVEELQPIKGVHIYRRGVEIPFIDLNTGDWVTVRFKAKPI